MTSGEPQKECPMCAGTGKVQDYGKATLPDTAATFFVFTPGDLAYDPFAMMGT